MVESLGIMSKIPFMPISIFPQFAQSGLPLHGMFEMYMRHFVVPVRSQMFFSGFVFADKIFIGTALFLFSCQMHGRCLHITMLEKARKSVGLGSVLT